MTDLARDASTDASRHPVASGPAPIPAGLRNSDESPTQAAIPVGGLGDTLWRRRSVRAQLLITIILIDLIAALAAGGVVIFQTRTSVQVEVAASMRLAEALVRETIQMQQGVPAERFLTDLPLQLRFLRHIRITAHDAAGRIVATRPTPDPSEQPKGDDRPAPPAWFASLVASSIEQHEFPMMDGGRTIGSVVVASEPRDEIAEAWEHTAALGTVALMVNLAVIGILYLLFGRLLEPIARLAGGLSDLEHRSYDVRPPLPKASELAAITLRFNALAAALETMRGENRRLNHRMITIQDDERRHIALELHDELGPNLFGLKAMAGSVALAVGDAKDAAGRRVAERIREMLPVIENVQAMNRGLLNRLRPMALGHVPLGDLLDGMIRDRAQQHPQISITFTGRDLTGGYGDSIELTVYRCVQEGLTNAIRHAEPRTITVELAEAAEDDPSGSPSASRLNLSIRDDGRGMDAARPHGFGLLGMQERVQALGGVYSVESGNGRGTCVRIVIPVHAPADAEPLKP